ncbi:MAG: 1-acyl-sn-glycerol-3-phosphate acyltransferase [Psychromonas sp.]|nr:1-acyl-sn-glycerol-3-phosphate acyltransferase [Psychromonas sp.]
MPCSTDKFNKIRPYNDTEIHPTILRIINNNEFLNAIISFRFNKLPKFIIWLIKPLIRYYLLYKWGSINSIDQMQQVVGKYITRMITSTTTEFTYSGLDNLNRSKNYLFVSNHRDISMDPSFVNWALHTEKFKTSRIAMGDNLLKKPFISDIMRMNKSFIVIRGLTAPRKMLKALLNLSQFIACSLKNGNSIWIAQREGRAKDGNDKTDPVILKMFYMAGKKQKKSFPEYIKSLNIVPVAISYEFDTCDQQKAQELYKKAQTGEYKKSEFEDIESIIRGIVGQKGAVNVSFGQPLQEDYETPEDAALEIDSQIYKNYKLHSTNFIAAEKHLAEISQNDKDVFKARLQRIPSELREIVISIYANPVKNKDAY